MKVSVIIPFREKNQKVINCINSIKNQDYKDLEIIALSDKVQLELDGVKSFLNENWKAVGEKRNFGAKVAQGEILFFIDSDCVAKKDAISQMIKIFQKYSADAISGKPLAPEKGNLLGIATGLEYEDRFDEMGEGFVDVAATTCLGLYKKAFLDVGGFVDYKRGEATGEDWDFSARFRNKGYKIYHTNKVLVVHDHGDESLSHWFKRRIQHSRYRIVHLKKYGKGFDQYSSFRMMVESTFFLSIPIMIRILKKKRNLKALSLPFFAFLRNIAWTIGVLTGLIEVRRMKILFKKIK